MVLGILWLGQLTGFAIVPFGPKTGPFPPFSHKQKVKYPKEKTQLVNPAEREKRGVDSPWVAMKWLDLW